MTYYVRIKKRSVGGWGGAGAGVAAMSRRGHLPEVLGSEAASLSPSCWGPRLLLLSPSALTRPPGSCGRPAALLSRAEPHPPQTPALAAPEPETARRARH